MLLGASRAASMGGRPNTRAVPAVGRMSPARMRIRVVLPAASGPTSPVIRPAGRSALTPSRAGGPDAPKRMPRSRSVTAMLSVADAASVLLIGPPGQETRAG